MRKYLSLIASIIIASMIMLTFSSCVEYEEENTQPSEEVSESESIESESGEKSSDTLSGWESINNPDNFGSAGGNNETTEKTESVIWPEVVVPSYSDIKVYADMKDVAVDFYNPKENANYYNILFELRLLGDSDRDYEVLYKSELIEPDSHIQKITLSRTLDKGEYDAVICVKPYRLDGKMTPVRAISINVKLVVTTFKWKHVSIPGWGEITLPPNTTEIQCDFYNPVENEGYYYLTFELRLPDDSAQGYEVLYNSGLLAPGEHTQTITLSRGFPEGKYDAILHVQPYRMDGLMTPTNNLNSSIKLRVVDLGL